MNNLIQASVSASTSTQPSKNSTVESNDSLESSDDSVGFSAALASAESTEKPLADDSLDPLENENVVSGSNLPAEDVVLRQALMLLQDEQDINEQQPILWQTSMLLPPLENSAVNSTSPQLQSISLLDGRDKPILNPDFYKQDYFNIMSMQNKEAAGMPANNINMQLAGTAFVPEANEILLTNVTEQLQPLQGISTTLSQSLAATGLGTATQAAATQTQMLPLNLGQNAWETNLGSRLQMMVGQNVQAAEIRLDPPELGALDIKIKITNDVASISINSAHAQVREALEAAVPKLREMFEESGLSLGDVNVRQESFAQQQNGADTAPERQGQIAENDFEGEQPTVHRKIISDNLLDIYA